MAYFAHIHRQTSLVAEGAEVAYCLLAGIASVAVAAVHYLVVEAPVAEVVEAAVPLRASEYDDVVAVHLADFGYGFLVEGLEHRVEMLVVEVGGNGLVHKLVAQDHAFVGVVFGDSPPYILEQLPGRGAFEEPWVAVAVVDVVTGLAARAVVHVEYQIEPCIAAPFHKSVHDEEAVLV